MNFAALEFMGEGKDGFHMVSYVLYKDKLKDTYAKAFDYVETYASALGVPEQDLEEMLNNLLDTLYEAQENGKPVEKIVGKDLETFCREYFQNYTYWGNFFKNLAPMFYRFAVIVFLFSLIDIIYPEENTTLLHAATDLGGFVCGAVCGIIAGIMIASVGRVLLSRSKRFTNTMYTWMTVIIVVAAIIVSVILCQDVYITVPLLPVLLVSAGYIILYKLAEWVKRYRKYGTIKKSAENRYSLKDTMKEVWNDENKDMQFDVLKEMIKTYRKKNERLTKRGKNAITAEEYTEQVRKDIKFEKYNLGYFVFLAVICVSVAILLTEFEGMIDFIVFLVIMAGVEGVILRFFYKSTKTGFDIKKALLNECDAKGITLVELFERKKAGNV